MNWMPRKRLFGALAIAGLSMIWAFLVAQPHFFGKASLTDPLEHRLLNLRMTSFPAPPPSDRVVIVAIDDATLNTKNPLGTGRASLADIVEEIADAGATVVTLDILLTDEGSAQGDRDLAAALAKVPTVIAAAGTSDPVTGLQGIPVTQAELWPRAMFEQQAQLGMANISTDQVGVPRHIPIVFMTSKGVFPSLAAQTAALFQNSPLNLAGEALTIAGQEIPLDQQYQMPLRMYGPEGTIKTVSALDVLAGTVSAELDGRAVFIGVTATGLGDRFPTPFDPDMPGVEVMATATSQLIAAQAPRRDSAIRKLDMAAVLVLAPLCAVLALSLPLVWGLSLGAGVLALWMASVWVAFPVGVWLSGALPLAAVIPPLIGSALIRYRTERRAAALSDRAVTALKKFQSPLLAELIAKNPDYLSAPETRQLAICFTDLTGFTQISQNMGATDSESFLKQFHTSLSDIAQEHNGIILNFMGDGALLAFGVIGSSKEAADQAFQAAQDITEATTALGIANGFTQPLGCRTGLHFGEVILSRLGGEQHQQLTISGDSVNLASRLLEIAKTQSASIAATGDFRANLVSRDQTEPTHTATFPIRGRHGTVSISFWQV